MQLLHLARLTCVGALRPLVHRPLRMGLTLMVHLTRAQVLVLRRPVRQLVGLLIQSLVWDLEYRYPTL